MKKRSTEIETNQRVTEMAKAILSGYSNRRNLFQYVSENFDWNVSERQLDNYLKAAREIINEIASNDLDLEKNIALNRLDALYTMNYKIHDFRECRNVIESRAKMLGLNAAEKIDHTTKGDKLPQTPIVNVYNTAPPLASNESDVDV